MRLRMAYLRRVIVSSPPPLLAVMRQRPNGRRSPWLDLIVTDLERMKSLVARCGVLPPLDADPQAWISYIGENLLRWKQDTNMAFFTDSICDPSEAVMTSVKIRVFFPSVPIAHPRSRRRNSLPCTATGNILTDVRNVTMLVMMACA